MRLVILESPFRGETPEDESRNRQYAHAAMLDSLHRGESPLASHLLWPGILDDAKPEERALGISAGLAWGRVAEATVVYQDLGTSEGMVEGIKRAHSSGRPVEFRNIPFPAQAAKERPKRERGGHDSRLLSKSRL